MNPEIKKIHKELIKTHQTLAKRLGATSDPDEAEAILREMDEVNFRVMMAGRLLFKETTLIIDSGISAVMRASADLDQSLKSISKLKGLISAVGKFLTVVDRTLDKIKAL